MKNNFPVLPVFLVWAGKLFVGEKCMNSKVEKIISYAMPVLLIVLLLPVIYLGRYNHPAGDDYYYGVTTKLVWEETGSIVAVLAEAAKGVMREYQEWQGTYSAMFLMHLSPNLFGDWAYRLVPAAIIVSLVGSIFYFFKPILCDCLKGSKKLWVLVSSVLGILCVETVPSQAETFFWYNGSMYYTGYFAATLFLFGVLFRWLKNGGKGKLVFMVFWSLFLAGGNYVSFLPCLLLLVTIMAMLCIKRDKRAWGVGLLVAAMLLGFLISALAPGNQVRQADMWKIPAWKAVLKSLLQGVRYFWAWTRGWWLLGAVVITPFLWKGLKQISFRFPLPILVIGYIYGIFCSMSCPTFYTMNSTGPARAVAIVYYGYMIISFLCYGYLLGYIQKKWLERCQRKCQIEEQIKVEPKKCPIAVIVLSSIVLLLGLQIWNGGAASTTTAKAWKLLATGEAAAYEQEYQERLKILEDDSVKDVVFEPYEHRPEMLYVGDISGDVNEPTNVRVALYFHKNSVRTEY